MRGYQPGTHRVVRPRTNGYTIFAGTYGGSAKVSTVAPKLAAKQNAAKQNKAGKKAIAKAKAAEGLGIAPSTKLWSSSIPLTGKAIAMAGDVLFVAGTPVAFPEGDLAKAYEGRMGGVLWAASAASGEKLAQYTLDAPPAWDGLAAANGMLFLSLADGHVLCMGPQ